MMGYRSDVTILFYAVEEYFPILKLWVDENLIPELTVQGDIDSLADFDRGRLRGYALEYKGVKWYESYNDVQKIEAMKQKFIEVFDGNEAAPLCVEWARIGEDYEDVEVGRSDNAEAHYVLNISRSIDY